jgi:hypothetical protein
LRSNQAAFVPEPSVGVGDLAQVPWDRVGGGSFDHALNFCHDLRDVFGGTHPVDGFHGTFLVNVHIQHADSFQQWRHAAFVNALGIHAVQMPCRIFSVFFAVASK